MSGIDDRFDQLPAEGNPAGGPRPSFAAAMRTGNTMITSGQTAVTATGLLASGRLGDTVDLETGRRCARQCARNVVAAARAELGSLDRIVGVLRITVFVASAAGFTDQHLVADGASEYLYELFGPELGTHTRSALGVAELPTGSPVEIEGIFLIAD